MIPGTVAPVFETDLGRVGLLICFDLNFPEVRVALKESRPDVVVFSSMYRGGLQAQALAFELRSFVVTSIASELGLIIDRAGRILKESTYEALAVAPINTNSVAMHMDFNWNKMDAMLAKYGPALTFDYHTREAFFVIESTRDEDIEAIVKEFQLEPADAYFDRSRRVRSEMLEKFEKVQGRPGAIVNSNQDGGRIDVAESRVAMLLGVMGGAAGMLTARACSAVGSGLEIGLAGAGSPVQARRRGRPPRRSRIGLRRNDGPIRRPGA